MKPNSGGAAGEPGDHFDGREHFGRLADFAGGALFGRFDGEPQILLARFLDALAADRGDGSLPEVVGARERGLIAGDRFEHGVVERFEQVMRFTRLGIERARKIDVIGQRIRLTPVRTMHAEVVRHSEAAYERSREKQGEAIASRRRSRWPSLGRAARVGSPPEFGGATGKLVRSRRVVDRLDSGEQRLADAVGNSL